MEKKRATLTILTMDPQQREDCINYITFGAGESLSVKWQRPKRLDNYELNTTMENMGGNGAAADVNQTYRETDTITELNIRCIAFK